MRRILIVAMLLSLLGLGVQQVWAQTAGASRYFPETGHWVTNEFLEKYESAANPSLIYGFPITEAFLDETSGRLVQYFQKARFEFHPEEPLPELKVKLSPLGEYLYQPGEPQPALVNRPACRDFSTGHRVCLAFLDFFEKYGGVAQFGYPISDREDQDGWIVQYFQYARFEWHPEFPKGQTVTLTQLGSRYFLENKEKPALLRPYTGENIPQLPILSIRAHAFVNTPVMPHQGEQTLFVIVQDQNLNPVPGATVSFILELPGGIEKNYSMSNTNAQGFTALSFPIKTEELGRAKITVTVAYKNIEGETRTAFQIWW